MLRNNELHDEDEKLDYSFCFIAHPAPVTDFSWRRISKYMPRYYNIRCSVCTDNFCIVKWQSGLISGAICNFLEAL